MSWSCSSCGRLVTSNPTICDSCGAAAPGADPNYVNLALQRDRVMEGHLMALALWHRIGAVLVGLGAVALLIGGGSLLGMGRHSSGFEGAAGGIMAMVAIILLVAGGFSYALGHFLARYAAWARITAGVFAAIGLAMNVISMVMGLWLSARMSDVSYGYSSYSSGPSAAGVIIRGLISIAWAASITWVFFNRRSAQITTPAYQELVSQTPHIKPSTYRSPFFIIPMVLIGIVVLLVVFGILMMTGRSGSSF
jgi:hypothetical protein